MWVSKEGAQFKTCYALGSCGKFLIGQSKGKSRPQERTGWEIQHRESSQNGCNRPSNWIIFQKYFFNLVSTDPPPRGPWTRMYFNIISFSVILFRILRTENYDSKK